LGVCVLVAVGKLVGGLVAVRVADGVNVAVLAGAGDSVGVGVKVCDGKADGSSASAVGDGDGGIKVGVTGMPVCRLQAIDASANGSASTASENRFRIGPGRRITNLLALCYRIARIHRKPLRRRLAAVYPMLIQTFRT